MPPTHAAACLSLVLMAVPAFAAEPPPEGKPIVTRRYDVADLLTGGRPDDKSDPADRPLGPDDLIGLKSSTVSESRASLVKLFREAIEPKSWREAGGWFDISLDRNELVVTQTAENQAQVASIVRQLKGDASDRVYHKFDAAVVPKLALRDATLSDALAEVARASGVKVEVDWAKFRTAGLTGETRVTLAAERLRAPVAVRAIFRAAGMAADAAPELDYTAEAVVVKPATATRPYSGMHSLQYLPARAAGLPAEPKPTRAAVLAAVVKRLAGEFPKLTFKVTDAVVIFTATPAEHRRFQERLYDLETGPDK
jgi:hypothetical protein